MEKTCHGINLILLYVSSYLLCLRFRVIGLLFLFQNSQCTLQYGHIIQND